MTSGVQIGLTGNNGQVISGGVWNANNSNGQPVSNGVYTIKVEVKNAFGQVTSLMQNVQVISVVPVNALEIFNSAGEVVAHMILPPVANGHRFVAMSMPATTYAPVYSASSGNAQASLQFNLTEDTGASVSLGWNGLNDQGVPVASGSYTAQLIYNAPGGGGAKTVTDQAFVVIQKNAPAGFAGAFAYPNPAVHGSDLRVSYPVTQAYSVVGELYNLNGEVVESATDSLQTGVLTFPTAHLASGIYLVSLSKNQDQTVAVSRGILKVAIVH